MPKEPTDLAVRKKMRKGTHSCFECRRRKIRCIFPADNPNVCSECFARGSRCIDQEHATPDVIVDHRKNLRERVSRLEALVESLLEEKTERSQTDTSTSPKPKSVARDTFPPTPLSSEASSSVFPFPVAQRAVSDRGHHVPILSVFEDALNDAEEKIKARMEQEGTPMRNPCPMAPGAPGERFTITNQNPEDMMDENSAWANAKKERSRQGLLAILPPYDQLQKIFRSNGDWWHTWRRKCSGTSTLEEPLIQFASRALASGNIGALGTVVLSVGICVADETDIEKYIDAVDRYVISDDEYAATLEGIECLILKAKWYADVGQPRRAWISYRKGLTYTQLMGLHRQRTTSAAHESIWWTLYHGDRCLSLLLGLPYGVVDSHCDLSLPDMGSGPFLAPLLFMNKLSILAGKVIDRNQGVAEQSFAWALQLDQELEDLWKQLDPAWLEYSDLLVDIEKNAAELRERLMTQMVYHQIRVYLHLPFMLKSQSNARFSFSRTACLNGSREVMRLYQAMRTGEVQPLYECKAIDFISFTAAVLIMLGLYNFGAKMGGNMSPKDQETDVRLVEMSIDIFRRASSEKGGKVALQSAQVLERMLNKFKNEFGSESGSQSGPQGCETDFVIPYFGTISIRRGGQKAQPPQGATFKKPMLSTSPTQITPSSENTGSELFGQSRGTTTPATTASGTLNFNTDPMVSYDGFYNWPASHADGTIASVTTGDALGAHVNDDSMNNYPLPTNNFSWQNMQVPMDIDQDWSWFLNDGTSTQVQSEQVGDQFAQQTFTGFG